MRRRIPTLPPQLGGRDNNRLHAWGNRSEPILFVLSIPGSISYVGLIRLSDLPEVHYSFFLWGACSIVFAADLIARTWLTENRLDFLKTHRLDMLTVLFPLLKAYRGIEYEPHPWLVAFFNSRPMLPGGIVPVAGTGFVLVYFVLSFLVRAERDAGGEIDDYWTAIWWAIGTLTTVGYGDFVPITTTGRVAAGFLMLLGIGGFSLLIIRMGRVLFQQQGDTTQKELVSIRTELRSLRRELHQHHRSTHQPPTSTTEDRE